MCEVCTTPTMAFVDGLFQEVETPEKIHYTSLNFRLQKYIEFAYNAAYTHEGISNSRICSILLYKNKPISIGFNSSKTHPMQAKYGKNKNAIFVHAEIDAIRKAVNFLDLDQFSKSTLIVMRAKRFQKWGLARPCIHANGQGCQMAINAFGIKNVIYSTSDTGYVSYL